MKIIRNPSQMQAAIKKIRDGKKTVGFVPTMGALHKGHSSLIRRSRKDNDFTVVSIFVNPAQFGPNEDLKRYPRPVNNDISICKKEGVDLIFYPSVTSMYPNGFKTYICVEGLSSLLCGRPRPGHFRGVATVVAKLFNIIGPDSAYFGQKDAQQAVIIKRMAADLNIPVKIKVIPTVRERDGLALSSRNLYLSSEERKDALALHGSLRLAKKMVNSGIRNADRIISAMKRLIKNKKTARIDYVVIVDPVNLGPVRRVSAGSLAAVAVWIGKIRLIDNICLKY